jgi:hypothetical protein
LFTRFSAQWTVERSDTDDFVCGSQSQHVQPWLRRKRPIGVEMGKLIYAAIASLDGLNRC